MTTREPDFEKIESLFSELLEGAGETLSASERGEVQAFIDVSEYGLALETAVDIYAEERRPPPECVVKIVESLASQMSMEAAFLLKRFPVRRDGSS